MALFLFTAAILEDRPIDVFNYGQMQRDFTYIDDIVEGVVRILDRIPQPDPGWDSEKSDCSRSSAPYRIYNIGNNRSVELMEFIRILEKKLGKAAKMNMLPMQPGDVRASRADIEELERDAGFRPQTPLEEGISRFVDWYRDYYRK